VTECCCNWCTCVIDTVRYHLLSADNCVGQWGNLDRYTSRVRWTDLYVLSRNSWALYKHASVFFVGCRDKMFSSWGNMFACVSLVPFGYILQCISAEVVWLYVWRTVVDFVGTGDISIQIWQHCSPYCTSCLLINLIPSQTTRTNSAVRFDVCRLFIKTTQTVMRRFQETVKRDCYSIVRLCSLLLIPSQIHLTVRCRLEPLRYPLRKPPTHETKPLWTGVWSW